MITAAQILTEYESGLAKVNETPQDVEVRSMFFAGMLLMGTMLKKELRQQRAPKEMIQVIDQFADVACEELEEIT